MAIKSGLVGLAFALVLNIASLSSASWLAECALAYFQNASGQGSFELGGLLGVFLSILLVYTVLYCLEELVIGTAIVKFATSEVRQGGSGWSRSLWVSLKASVVGFLWMVLITGLCIGLSILILLTSIGTLSFTAVAAGLTSIFVILAISSMLVILAPTASIMKYLVDELSHLAESSKAEETKQPEEQRKREEPQQMAKTYKASEAVLIPQLTRGLKKECGSCRHYLTSECPREYPRDDEVYRVQKTCEMFRPRGNSETNK